MIRNAEHTLSPQSVVVPVEPTELVNKLVQELAPDQGQSASIAFGLALELQGVIAVPPYSAALRADLNNYVTRCIRSTPEADMSLEEALIARAARALSAPAPSSLAGGEVERAARLIDPKAWEFADKFSTGPHAEMMRAEVKCETAASLRIAGEVLAALSPEAPAREGVESFDNVEARAEAWSDRADIQRMVEATTGVFAKWSGPEILSRFRQQFMAVVQQAYIEGYDAALTPRHEAPASEGDAS